MERDMPDGVRFELNALQWLANDAALQLSDRGWVVADLEVSDDKPLEWFWPPTAPVGYSGLPEPGEAMKQRRPQLYVLRQTPWTAPTRLSKTDDGWMLEYGEAAAQKPARSRKYADESKLIADLERIECWPMSIEETRRIRNERLVTVATAFAWDDHYLGMNVTEPYTSRINVIRDHKSYERFQVSRIGQETKPSSGRPRGDLTAQYLLVDAEAWASAVRTALAGGEGWGPSGRVRR